MVKLYSHEEAAAFPCMFSFTSLRATVTINDNNSIYAVSHVYLFSRPPEVLKIMIRLTVTDGHEYKSHPRFNEKQINNKSAKRSTVYTDITIGIKVRLDI